MKKSLLMALCIALAAALSIGGTMAYLQDSDSDVNVMTLGNVYIEQIELQRKDQSAENNTDNLEGFKDDKPLFPAVYDDMDWDDDWQDWSTGGSSALFADSMKNVVDKFVFVENTGKSPAYVRTWFAFEQGDLTEEAFEALVGQNINDSHWKWETIASNVEIQGGKYLIKVATYLGNAGENHDVHPNGKLPAGETTRPSLLQVMLYKHAGNEDVAALDSNGDNVYNILVVSQAIQTEGFDSAEAALTEGFGAAEVENHPFDELNLEEEPPAANEVAVTAANLSTIDFTQDNATFKLSGNFSEDITFNIPEGLNQVYNASAANFVGESTVTINAPGVAHAYSSLNAKRAGTVTITGFEVETLNVLAYNNEAVNITNNKINALSVIGGNFVLNIDSNLVDGNFGNYTDGENQDNDYGISLRITDYELSMTNNTITDTYSHAIGINGRQGEVASDWGSCGANNKITKFSGNTITLNTTYKTERGALKIWCDQVYAPYATSGHEPNAAAKALMAEILADTTNVFTIGEGHTIFNIFDYTTSTVVE